MSAWAKRVAVTGSRTSGMGACLRRAPEDKMEMENYFENFLSSFRQAQNLQKPVFKIIFLIMLFSWVIQLVG